MSSLAIIGAGPNGTVLLERLVANARELLPGSHPLTIHLVDPCPPGPGAVWQLSQSPVLYMNTPAGNVTMFTDHRSRMAGPINPGPNLAEWAATHGADAPDADLREELHRLGPGDFATRRAQGAYLAWAFDRIRRHLPENITLKTHATIATDLTEDTEGRQHLHLADATTVSADAAVLAMGHLDVLPDDAQQRLAERAAEHGLIYLPPAIHPEQGIDRLAPEEDVLLRGIGLAFLDIVALLTEARGGRFRPQSDGTLTYLPSGKEPRLHVGSRHGMPYRCKRARRGPDTPPPLPRFFDDRTVEALIALPRRIDFQTDIRPLVDKELGWAHYHQLFLDNRRHTTATWSEFARRYAELPWNTQEMKDLIAACVPDPEHRLDIEALAGPLTGRTFTSAADLQAHVIRHIEADLAGCTPTAPAHGPDLGVLAAVNSIARLMHSLAASGRLDARSHARDLDGWWRGLHHAQAIGPPPFRARQLAALARAGVLHFLGPDLDVTLDTERPGFAARSPAVPGRTTEATALVEARLPHPSVRGSASQLLRNLHQRGEIVEDLALDDGPDPRPYPKGTVAIDPHSAVLRADGTAHPRRFAIGPLAHGEETSRLPKPHRDSPILARNDAVARTLLRRTGGS